MRPQAYRAVDNRQLWNKVGSSMKKFALLILSSCLLLSSCDTEETTPPEIKQEIGQATPENSGVASAPTLDPLFHLETLYAEEDFRQIEVGREVWIPFDRWIDKQLSEFQIPSPNEEKTLTIRYENGEKSPSSVDGITNFSVEVFIDDELLRHLDLEYIHMIGEKWGGFFYGNVKVNDRKGHTTLDGFPVEWLDDETISVFKGGFIYHLPTQTWIEPEFPEKEEIYIDEYELEQFSPHDSVGTAISPDRGSIAYLFECKYDRPKSRQLMFLYLYEFESKEWKQVFVSQVQASDGISFLHWSPEGKLLFYADEVVNPDNYSKAQERKQTIYSYNPQTDELEEYLVSENPMLLIDAIGELAAFRTSTGDANTVVINVITKKPIIMGPDSFYFIYHGKYVIAPESGKVYDLQNMVVYLLSDPPATLVESFTTSSSNNAITVAPPNSEIEFYLLDIEALQKYSRER